MTGLAMAVSPAFAQDDDGDEPQAEAADARAEEDRTEEEAPSPTPVEAPTPGPEEDEEPSSEAEERPIRSSENAERPRQRPAPAVESTQPTPEPSGAEPELEVAEDEEVEEVELAPGKKVKKKKKKHNVDEDGKAAAALGAANPVVALETGKPWQLMAEVGTTLGSSTFTRNQATAAGYSVALTGLYKLAPLFEGRLDAVVRTSFDQTIAEGYNAGLFAGATSPNQAFFRDIRVGVLGRGLYRLEALGLTFGANAIIDIPTSENAQFWGRIFRWNLGVNAVELLQNVGPGNLLITLFGTFRQDVGQMNPVVQRERENQQIAVCRNANQDDQGNCLTDVAPFAFGVVYGGSLRYLLGSFTMGFGVSLISNFGHQLRDSALGGTLEGGIPASQAGSSNNATDALDHTLFMFTSADVTYVVSQNMNVSLGLSAFQLPIRYQDDGWGLVWPFFDSPERGFTNLALNFTFMY